MYRLSSLKFPLSRSIACCSVNPLIPSESPLALVLSIGGSTLNCRVGCLLG